MRNLHHRAQRHFPISCSAPFCSTDFVIRLVDWSKSIWFRVCTILLKNWALSTSLDPCHRSNELHVIFLNAVSFESDSGKVYQIWFFMYSFNLNTTIQNYNLFTFHFSSNTKSFIYFLSIKQNKVGNTCELRKTFPNIILVCRGVVAKVIMSLHLNDFNDVSSPIQKNQ